MYVFVSVCVVCVVEDNSAGHATFSGEKLSVLSLEKDIVSFNPFGSEPLTWLLNGKVTSHGKKLRSSGVPK